MTEQSSDPTAEGLTKIRARIAEREDEWAWHEQTDDMIAGHGYHMSQMLYRLPRDGQTRDMRASIESMLADLNLLADRLAAVQAERDEWGRIAEQRLQAEVAALARAESAEAERDDLRAALDRVKALMRLGSKSRGYWQSADGPGSVSGICEDDLRAAVEGGRL